MNFTNKKTDKKRVLGAFILSSCMLLSACGEPTAAQKAPLSQYTQQGNTYLAQHQFKAAITAAKNAIATYPEEIDGYLILAKIYNQLGQANSATMVLNAYKNDKTADYYFLLLDAYQNDNKLISANALIVEQNDLLQQQPNRLMKEKAKLHLRSKQINEALNLFKTLQSSPEYKVDALIGQARVAAISNDSEGSIALLNQAFLLDPKNSESLILKGYLLINNGDLLAAEEVLSQALTVIPSTDIFTPERINILQALTQVLSAQGRSAEALLYSRILADEFPEASSINQNYLEATKQFKNKEYTLAKQSLDNILKSSPGNKKALSLYGIILYTEGDIKGAQSYLEGIVDPEKDSTELTQLYAMTQLKLDNANDVLSMLETTIATETSNEILTIYMLAAIKQQQFDKAKFAVDKMVALYPTNVKSTLAAAHYYSSLNNPEHQKALNILQQAIEKNDTDIQLQTAYLKKLVYLKKEDTADTYVNALNQTKNKSIETQILIAQYKLYRQQYQQAQQLFSEILEKNQGNLSALYGIAQINQTTKKWKEAQATYRNIILFHPTELKAYQGFIYAQLKNGEDIEQSTNKLPENHDRALLALVVADAALQQKNTPLASEQVNIAAQGLDSRLLPYLAQLKQKIHYQQALSALVNNDFDSARQITLSELTSSPKQPALLMLLANIELQSGQLNEANKVIQQIEQILPNNHLVSIYQAELALAEKNPNKAITLLNEKWQQNKDEEIAKKLYNILYQHDKKQAKSFLTQWQNSSPDSIAATLNRALQLQSAGDNSNALALYEAVLKKMPFELTSLNNSAWLYFQLNDNRAEILAEKAYSVAPSNPAILDTYGWILYKAGKTEKAKKLIQEAHELAPNNSDIEEHWLEIKDK